MLCFVPSNTKKKSKNWKSLLSRDNGVRERYKQLEYISHKINSENPEGKKSFKLGVKCVLYKLGLITKMKKTSCEISKGIILRSSKT